MCPDSVLTHMRQSSLPEVALSRPRGGSRSQDYDATSSTCARSNRGAAKPSARAVLMLTTSSNLVGCSTGSSAGLAPFTIPLHRRELRLGRRLTGPRGTAGEDLHDAGRKPDQYTNLPGVAVGAGRIEDETTAPCPQRGPYLVHDE